jgi:hypothetical protein
MINAQSMRTVNVIQATQAVAAATWMTSAASGASSGWVGRNIDTAGYDYLSVVIDVGKGTSAGSPQLFTSGALFHSVANTTAAMVVIEATRFWDSSAGAGTAAGAFMTPVATTLVGWTARMDIDLTEVNRFVGVQLRTLAATGNIPFSVVGTLSRAEQSPWDSTGVVNNSGANVYARVVGTTRTG